MKRTLAIALVALLAAAATLHAQDIRTVRELLAAYADKGPAPEVTAHLSPAVVHAAALESDYVNRFPGATGKELRDDLSVYPEGNDWYTVMLETRRPAPIMRLKAHEDPAGVRVEYIMPKAMGPLFGDEYLPRSVEPGPVSGADPESFVNSFFLNYLDICATAQTDMPVQLATLRARYTALGPATEGHTEDPVLREPLPGPGCADSLRTLRLSDNIVAVSYSTPAWDEGTRREVRRTRTLLAAVDATEDGFRITAVNPYDGE